MADQHARLREALEQLRLQLDELRARDPAVADRLQETLAEAEAALDGPSQGEANDSIVKRLSDAVLDYEATHPSLAGNLGSVIDALGRMGI
jgi:hypothetical protein